MDIRSRKGSHLLIAICAAPPSPGVWPGTGRSYPSGSGPSSSFVHDLALDDVSLARGLTAGRTARRSLGPRLGGRLLLGIHRLAHALVGLHERVRGGLDPLNVVALERFLHL